MQYKFLFERKPFCNIEPILKKGLKSKKKILEVNCAIYKEKDKKIERKLKLEVELSWMR